MLTGFICLVLLSCGCYVLFAFFIFLLCVHIPPHSFILILTIYTAFCLLGSLPIWSHHITLSIRPASPTRPSSRQQSNRNPPRVTSAPSTARECRSSDPFRLCHCAEPVAAGKWLLGGGSVQGWRAVCDSGRCPARVGSGLIETGRTCPGWRRR